MSTAADHPRIVLNPFVIYIGMGLIAWLLQRLIPLPFLAETPARLLGLSLLLTNIAIGLPAARAMLSARTSLNPARPTTSLVESASFSFTRNPLYLGLTILYTGLVTIFRLPWGWLLLPLVILLVTQWVIIPEEKYLEEKFGRQYLDYKQRVRRWL